MDKCSISLILIQKGDKFSLMQCLKNDLERKQNGEYSLCISCWEFDVCLNMYDARY